MFLQIILEAERIGEKVGADFHPRFADLVGCRGHGMGATFQYQDIEVGKALL